MTATMRGIMLNCRISRSTFRDFVEGFAVEGKFITEKEVKVIYRDLKIVDQI